MAAQAFILFPDATTWRFCVVASGQTRSGEIAVPARASATQIATFVAEALQAAGYSGGGGMNQPVGYGGPAPAGVNTGGAYMRRY